jgi:hypothetical protein
MKNLLLSIWKETHPIVALWIYGLLTLAVTGISFMLFQIITNPSQFNNVSFGIFDYI